MTDDLHIADWTLLRTAYEQLCRISDELNDEANVPERFHSTLSGIASNHDSRTIREAASIIHRLSLWAQYPKASPERYTTKPALMLDPGELDPRD